MSSKSMENSISHLSFFLNVTTTDDEIYSGNIHYYDKEKSIVILKIRDVEKNHENYHVINMNHIQKYDIQQNKDYQEILKNCLKIDLNLEDALLREAGIIIKEQKNYQNQVYDKLQQMYGAEYNKDNRNEIIIPDLSITIKSPFKSENVIGGERVPVERIQQILDALQQQQ